MVSTRPCKLSLYHPLRWSKSKAATDVLDRHDGQTVTLSHLSRFNKDAWTVYPEFGATWHSKDYNQYYYGILDTEALKPIIPHIKPILVGRPL